VTANTTYLECHVRDTSIVMETGERALTRCATGSAPKHTRSPCTAAQRCVRRSLRINLYQGKDSFLQLRQLVGPGMTPAAQRTTLGIRWQWQQGAGPCHVFQPALC
jgi:hypothetical protein